MSAKNRVDHVIYILDGSGSMERHKRNLIQVVDSQTVYLAEKYKAAEQETRVSMFRFSGRMEFDCLVYDTDVLRTPSIERLYKTTNMTALIDASIKTIDHLLKVPTEFGDHAFLVYLLTDGLENHSAKGPSDMRAKLASLPDNWTFAGFVPDAEAEKQLAACGVPANNIRVWNTADAAGVLEVGKIIRDTTDAFKEGRKQGVRGYKSGGLFTLNTLSVADIVHNLEPLHPSRYALLPVFGKVAIKDYVLNATGKPYKVGSAYYEFSKTETIQPTKEVAILVNGRVYVGKADQVRVMLGLPADYQKVAADINAPYKIFVQSTSVNRNLMPGTSVLIMV